MTHDVLRVAVVLVGLTVARGPAAAQTAKRAITLDDLAKLRSVSDASWTANSVSLEGFLAAWAGRLDTASP